MMNENLEKTMKSTPFNKSQFAFDGMYLTYSVCGDPIFGEPRRFVARFKRGGMSDFRRFLIKNFTVEEYFSMLDQGMSPLSILETKGFVTSQIAKILKRFGYPATLEGRDAYISDKLNARTA